MKNAISYKGFHANIEYDSNSEVFTYTLMNVETKVMSLTKKCYTIQDLRDEFADFIDRHIEATKVGVVTYNKHAGIVNLQLSEKQWKRIVDSETDPDIGLYIEISKIIEANS